MSSCEDICKNLCDILERKREIEKISDTFNALPSSKKVSFIYLLLEENGLLPTRKERSSKCTAEAVDYRIKGNEAFVQKKELEALNLYSESVRVSALNSQELSIAYANRSAVLFMLKKFDLCILDIDRALDICYPEKKKYKLYERRGKCLKEIGRCYEAKQSFQNALKYLFNADITPEQRSTLENSLNQYIDECEKSEGSCHEISSIRKLPLPELPSKNSLVPNASEKIRLNSSLEMGRHIVASQDIEPGEILAIEKPFASVLLPDYYTSHCSNCFVRNMAMIPCEKCSLVMFCDEKCRTESMTRFHTIECGILSFLLSLDVSKMELLSVRILLMATNQGKDLDTLFADPIYGCPLPFPSPSTLFNAGDIYLSENYETVHMLEENFGKRQTPDIYQRSVTAAVLLYVIKFSNFFENAKSELTYDEQEDLEPFTGTLLLKYLCISLCNAHEISEIVQSDSKPRSRLRNKCMEIGAALYPLLSLTNHSCNPNVTRHSYRDCVVLRSIQVIAKDEQIFDNYGYHYAVHNYNKRQGQLKSQYFFTCICEACRFKWPLYKDLPSINPRYIPIDVPLDELKKFSDNFKNVLCKIMNSETDGVFEELCKYLSLMHKSIQRPWKVYSECQEAIKECLAYEGNYYIKSTESE